LGYDYGVAFGSLTGYDSWFGAGTQFGYPSSPPLSSYFDKLQATGSGVAQFHDELWNQRMVRNTAQRTECRTVASSVAFAGFSESAPYSTQARLMARIVAYLMADDETPPEAISGLVTGQTANSIILSWDVVDQDAVGAPEALDCYVIDRSTVPFGRTSRIALVLDPTCEDSPSGFGNPDVNYYYVIRAVDTAGNMGGTAMAGAFDFAVEDGE